MAGEYKPRFPKAHALLLDIYSGLISSETDTDINIWAERFKTLQKSWEILDEEELLPPLFTKQFGADVENVLQRVHATKNTTDLNDTQSLLTFAMPVMATRFGAV